jgi:hypothetical protein
VNFCLTLGTDEHRTDGPEYLKVLLIVLFF